MMLVRPKASIRRPRTWMVAVMGWRSPAGANRETDFSAGFGMGGEVTIRIVSAKPANAEPV